VWAAKNLGISRTLACNAAAGCCKPTGAAIFNNEPADIQISARAVFSKYSITPARALNFGPAMYNTSAGPRTLEVTNVGEVPVNLRLFDPAKGLVSSASPRTA